MNYRFYNVNILTPEGIIERGEMWVEDGIITHVCNVSVLIYKPWDREIDCQGNLIMPAFKNAHAHSPMVFARSVSDNLELQDWLEKEIFPREERLTPEAVYWFSRLAVAEYVRGGIGASEDMYYFINEMASAFKDSNFKGNLIYSFSTDISLQDMERMLSDFVPKDKDSDLINYKVGFHAPYSNDKVRLKMLSEFYEKSGQKMHAHVSETCAEIKRSVEEYNLTPPQYLDSLGLMENGGVFYHGVHLSTEDIKIIQAKGVKVVGCPSSNIKLASGIADYVQLLNDGITVGLGTDGASSSNGLNMFKEMFLACGLQKIKYNKANILSAEKVVDMATINSAKCMEIDDSDTIQVGKRADLVMIDLNSENLIPNNDIVGDLVYSAGRENVLMTMIDGKVVYEKGEFFIGDDIEYIKEKVRKIINELKLGK